MAKKKKEEPQEETRKKKGGGLGRLLVVVGLILMALGAALIHSSDNAACVNMEEALYQKVKNVKVLGAVARPVLHREPWELRYTEKQALQLKANLFKANDKLDVLMNQTLPGLRDENRELKSKVEETRTQLAKLNGRVKAAERAAERSAAPATGAELVKEPKKLTGIINYRALAGRLDNLEAEKVVSILAEYSIEDRAEILKKMKAEKVDEIWGILEPGESANLLSLMSKETPAEVKN